MKATTKSYLAGIIDGEGTITLSRYPKRDFRYPVVSVSSTSLELLEFVKQCYGGSISKHKVYADHHKQSWSWKIANRLAISFLVDILPYLRVKEKIYRAELITNEYLTLTPRNGKYTPSNYSAKIDFEKRFFHPSGSIVIP